VEKVLIELALGLAAVMAIGLSPYGRRTLGEVRRDGLTFRHARQLVHVMAVVALLVAVVAALNLR
jgi:hypothetical protein